MGKSQSILVSLHAYAGHQLRTRYANEHLAVEQKCEAAKHSPLGNARSKAKRLADALSEAFVE
jgi:hypothetical protein